MYTFIVGILALEKVERLLPPEDCVKLLKDIQSVRNQLAKHLWLTRSRNREGVLPTLPLASRKNTTP